MKLTNQKAVWVIFFLLLFKITLTSQGEPAARGFDFVVIVDQSGSMSGTRGPASDGFGVRNDMVKRTFELLAKDGVINNVTHRFGVVSFGDDIRIDLPLSLITPATVEKLRRRLDSSISNESMGFTNFLAAFTAVKNMFTHGPIADPKKRVILLITDGAPYVEGIQIATYTRELEELVESRFPDDDYTVYVIALNDPSSNYWDRYGAFWKKLSSNHAIKLKEDREEIFRTLHRVINDILGTPSQHIPPDMYDNVVIPPYLESVVFDIFRVNPGVEVDIFSPDQPDQPLSPGSENVTFVNVGNTIKAVAVTNPKAGIWRIRKSDENARVDVYSQRFFPRGRLIQPNTDEPIRQYEKVAAIYCVEDGNHNPIEELPGYPLTLELSLLKPDGTRSQMGMQKSPLPTEKSIFKTTGEIMCDLPGTYKTEVLIATKDLKNKQVTLFRDQWSKFQVRAAKLIEGKLLSPEPLENIPPFKALIFIPNRLQFKFKFVDSEGDPVNLPAFFGGTKPDIITAYEVEGNGEKIVPMKLTPFQNGILIGQPGGNTNLGNHHLRFRPNNSIVPVHYTVKINPAELLFKRNLTFIHWIQLILLVGIVLAVVVFLGYHFYVNLRFPLKGTLYIDRLGDKPLAEYSFTGRRHSLKMKEFPNETMIKKIVIQSVREKREGIKIVKVIGYKKEDKKKMANKKRGNTMNNVIGNKTDVFLEDRILRDRGTASLNKVPYVLRYRVK
jgi:hypothetical protein